MKICFTKIFLAKICRFTKIYFYDLCRFTNNLFSKDMSFYQNLCCKSVVINVIKDLNFPVGKEKAARISCENILAAFCLASQLQLISVLQSVYFLPSCALASITLLLVERIGYIE